MPYYNFKGFCKTEPEKKKLLRDNELRNREDNVIPH